MAYDQKESLFLQLKNYGRLRFSPLLKNYTIHMINIKCTDNYLGEERSKIFFQNGIHNSHWENYILI